MRLINKEYLADLDQEDLSFPCTLAIATLAEESNLDIGDGQIGNTFLRNSVEKMSWRAQWMWANAGVLGFRRLGKWNPFRWSELAPLDEVCAELQKEQAKE